MNKAFYIVGIVMSFVFFVLTAVYSAETSDARYDSYRSYSSYSSYGSNYSNYTSYGDSAADWTTEAALWSIAFFLLFITIDLLGLIKIKTTTIKVLSIIGLSISGIFLLWSFVMLSSPGGISFDEVSPAWGLYCFVIFAFCIVGLVQSVQYGRKKVNSNTVLSNSNTEDLLDS